MENLITYDEGNDNMNSCYSELTHAPRLPSLDLELTSTSCLERKEAFDNGEWGDHRFGTMLVFRNLLNACVEYRNLNTEDDNRKATAQENILNRAALLWVWGALYRTNRIPEGWARLSKEQAYNLVTCVFDTIENSYNINITFILDM